MRPSICSGGKGIGFILDGWRAMASLAERGLHLLFKKLKR
jgi:hypothetical protein